MPPQLEERRPTMSPQLARRVAIFGGIAFVLFAALFFRLWFLQVLSGETYVSEAAQNRVRKVRIEAPRGNIVDRTGKKLVKTRQAAVVQILPGELPEAERDLAAEYNEKTSAAERDRLAARDRLRDLKRRDARRRKPPKLTAAQKAERRRLKRQGSKARAVAIPGLPADPAVRRLYQRLGNVIDVSPRAIHRRVIEQVAQTPYAAVTVKTDIGLAALQLPARAPGPVPRRPARDPVPAQLSARDHRRAPVRDAARDLAGRAQAQALQGRRRGRAHRQGRRRGVLRPLPARAGRLLPPGRRRAGRELRRPRPLRRPDRQAPAGPAAAALDRPQAAEGGDRGDGAPRRQASPARSSRWTRATARSSRSAPTRPSTRTCSPSRSARRITTRSTPRRRTRRWSTARSPAPIRRARPSS